MAESDYPKHIDYPMGKYDRYDLKQADENTWYVRDDGMPLGTICRDEQGYFKPGSDSRYDDFDTAVRLTIKGTMR